MLQQTLIPTPEPDIELTPRQQQELRVAFQKYQQLKDAVEKATTSLSAQKESLGRLRARLGEDSIGLDGYRVTLVSGGTTKRLDKRKLMRLGVSQGQIEQATVEKPKKAYELVTCPGDRKQVEDDE